jgi:hypothetical protein|tara:strand:+ start:6794 stop:7045 length:252 start_codon:yes stop_codon:yes gene_type:complete
VKEDLAAQTKKYNMKDNNEVHELIQLLIVVILAFGWILNIIELLKCDFEPSYKEEVIRTVGVFVPPIGFVCGYIEISDPRPSK